MVVAPARPAVAPTLTRSSRDLYSRITEIDEETLRSAAAGLERRGRHPQQVRMRDAYLDYLPDLTGARVLDVGCGTGVVARELARRVGPSGTVVGVDPSPWFLDIAEQLAAEEGLDNCRFLVGDARALNLPSEAFDAAISFTVLCHVPNAPALVRELARVVRPGGHLILCDADYASSLLEHPDRELTERMIAAYLDNRVNDGRVMRGIVPMLRRAGLEVLDLQGHVHVEAGTVVEAESHIWQFATFALREALANDAVTPAEGERWLEQLQRQNREGTGFGSINFYSVAARRRS